MKWLIVITVTLALIVNLIETKIVDKKYTTKKPSIFKSRKSTDNSILEQFKGLPLDDVNFIKQIDKQFETHGSKLRIKVVQENSSDVNKNGKRTIDGNLGYGYQNNNFRHGYYFTKPKYQIYPYSQHDIPPSPSYHKQSTDHHQQQYVHQGQTAHHTNRQYLPPDSSAQREYTSVKIEPSHGYEIKEKINHDYDSYNNGNYQQHQPQHYQQTFPVIVLRIPGPPKYAAHLQALLQQYLEIRAAQYIKLLQEQENTRYSMIIADKQQQQQQQQQYVYPEKGYTFTNGYTSEKQESYSAQNDNHDTSYQDQEEQYYHEQDTEQPHYDYIQSANNEHNSPSDPSYSQNIPQIYHHYQLPQSHQHQQSQFIYSKPIAITEPTDLPTSENYPRSTHTQVYFPMSLRSNKSPTPVVYHPKTFHPPLVEQQSDENDYTQNSDQDYEQSAQNNVPSDDIQQHSTTTAAPLNSYSFHSRFKGAKRQTSLTEDQYNKFSKLISRLKEQKSKENKNRKR